MLIKRLLTVAVLLFGIAGAIQAKNGLYELYKTPVTGNRPYFGIRASVGYAYPYHIKYARIPLSSKATGIDGSVMGLFRAPIDHRWYVEPQIEVYFNSLKTGGTLSEEVTKAGITEATLRTVGFRVPIAFGWRHNLSENMQLSLFTGPEFDFRIKTWFHPDKPSNIFKGTTARPLYGDYGVDLDLRSGAGLTLGRYYVGASYSWKLCKITRSDYGAKRQRLVQLTFGYNFKPL